MVQDIKAAFPDNPRIQFVLSGQGTYGFNKSSPNYNRAMGTADFNNDSFNKWHATPVSHHDYWSWAGYFSAPISFDSANLTMLSSQYATAANDEEKERICALYVDGIVGTGTGETISRYQNQLLPEYASAMFNIGKATIMYEGGWDRSVTSGTPQVNLFLSAVKKSNAWAKALVDFFRSFEAIPNAYMPADYIEIDRRWGHAYPDTYSGGIEGAGLDRAWMAIAEYNRTLP
jgi:hypothetical protein